MYHSISRLEEEPVTEKGLQPSILALQVQEVGTDAC